MSKSAQALKRLKSAHGSGAPVNSLPTFTFNVFPIRLNDSLNPALRQRHRLFRQQRIQRTLVVIP